MCAAFYIRRLTAPTFNVSIALSFRLNRNWKEVVLTNHCKVINEILKTHVTGDVVAKMEANIFSAIQHGRTGCQKSVQKTI